MIKYVCMLVKYFVGFCIDNCYLIFFYVVEYIFDEVCCVRFNLYVVVEFFMGFEEMDYVFVKRFGISFFICEVMQVWSIGELSCFVYCYGGCFIGSFEVDEILSVDVCSVFKINGINGINGVNGYYICEIICCIKLVFVQVFFMDCIYDNEVFVQKCDVCDMLFNVVFVSMCVSVIGSVMGYDEIYFCLIEFVYEIRLYIFEFFKFLVKVGEGKGGIVGVKKFFNQIYILMGMDGYDEMYIYYEDQYVIVYRVYLVFCKGYFFIVYIVFLGYGNGNGVFNFVYLIGIKVKYIGSWMFEVDVSKEVVEEVLSDKKLFCGFFSCLIGFFGVCMEVKG